ncbi:DNA topoisomerase I, mitochondrial-like isoform X1 [Lethenteron reissneri]|uniref:DNA topoisomerase I, mitochondrial-like isoform X1 n=1 Tax=Lethenteron reissneri TaxID=7753 RepID=UPI002AB64002|nr:DNA topoisomerase I, mitochondrial-like isoform X1 [Lethenteron reissneri]
MMVLGSDTGDGIVESWFTEPKRAKASLRDRGSKKVSGKSGRSLPTSPDRGKDVAKSTGASRGVKQGAERDTERTAVEAGGDRRTVKNEVAPPPPPLASDEARGHEGRSKRFRAARDNGAGIAEPSPLQKKNLSDTENRKRKREADKTKEEKSRGRKRLRSEEEEAEEEEREAENVGKTDKKKPSQREERRKESAREERRPRDKDEKQKKKNRDGERQKEEAKEEEAVEEEEVRPEKRRARTKGQLSEAAEKRKRVKEEEEKSKWKWWEEEKREDGVKWTSLEHKGPLFSPQYEPLPPTVNFYYDGKEVKLSVAAEEVATFFAKMLEHEYTTRDVFRQNFFRDWRKEMTKSEQKMIKDLDKCDFKEMLEYFKAQQEERKNMPKEEKQELKRKNEALLEEYGYCTMDGHRERIANFRVEPPGLFRGRGDHPKQGKLKLRLQPEDVIINCSRDSKVPEPPAGHRWKEVRHDGAVSWLASWTENVQCQNKYVMLNASSRVKGEKDWHKYEVARELKGCVAQIREQYRRDWKSREMKVRQCAVALYFIDKLALRAGNEKDEGEADTVGCCSLRVEHVRLHEKLDGQHNVVEFDFLGKDSIRYYNKVPVEKRVFKNLHLFTENKCPGDELFDRLNSTMLNKHLQTLMDGLSAKVFRTYNASITLQEQLAELTKPDESVAAKILSYNRANRAVAILCNHQRTPPKTYEQSMANLQAKVGTKQEQLREAQDDLARAKVDLKRHNDAKMQKIVEAKQKAVERIEQQLANMEVAVTDKEENKQIALGTSKLNYLDPRISVAWCKKFGVPIEKIYNKTQRDKFAWAIAMVDEDYVF